MNKTGSLKITAAEGIIPKSASLISWRWRCAENQRRMQPQELMLTGKQKPRKSHPWISWSHCAQEPQHLPSSLLCSQLCMMLFPVFSPIPDNPGLLDSLYGFSKDCAQCRSCLRIQGSFPALRDGWLLISPKPFWLKVWTRTPSLLKQIRPGRALPEGILSRRHIPRKPTPDCRGMLYSQKLFQELSSALHLTVTAVTPGF